MFKKSFPSFFTSIEKLDSCQITIRSDYFNMCLVNL